MGAKLEQESPLYVGVAVYWTLLEGDSPRIHRKMIINNTYKYLQLLLCLHPPCHVFKNIMWFFVLSCMKKVFQWHFCEMFLFWVAQNTTSCKDKTFVLYWIFFFFNLHNFKVNGNPPIVFHFMLCIQISRALRLMVLYYYKHLWLWAADKSPTQADIWNSFVNWSSSNAGFACYLLPYEVVN